VRTSRVSTGAVLPVEVISSVLYGDDCHETRTGEHEECLQNSGWITFWEKYILKTRK